MKKIFLILFFSIFLNAMLSFPDRISIILNKHLVDRLTLNKDEIKQIGVEVNIVKKDNFYLVTLKKPSKEPFKEKWDFSKNMQKLLTILKNKQQLDLSYKEIKKISSFAKKGGRTILYISNRC